MKICVTISIPALATQNRYVFLLELKSQYHRLKWYIFVDELAMYLDSLRTISTKLTIYYDGQCPLCLAEIHFLKHHNQKKLLDFVSLQELDPAKCNVNCELALKTIHADLGDKQTIIGADVFFEAYKRTDLRILNYIFSFAIFRYFYTKFYIFFAKYRRQISSVIGPLLLNFVQKKYPDTIKSNHDC